MFNNQFDRIPVPPHFSGGFFVSIQITLLTKLTLCDIIIKDIVICAVHALNCATANIENRRVKND